MYHRSKNRFFSALLDVVKGKDLSKLTVTELIPPRVAQRYHERKPASHHPKPYTSLLDIITECEINSNGDMSHTDLLDGK